MQLGAYLTGVWLARAAMVRRYRMVAIATVLGSVTLTATEAGPDTRTLHLYNIHTAERLTITYKQNGRYVPEALARLNEFVGDWRRKQSIKMDPTLFDLLWTVYQDTGATGNIHIVCGYRSPETNSMLRRRSKGVAKNSQHVRGKAMDFFIPSVPLDKLRAAGLRLQIGGVGYYPASGAPFVHMDTGSVRHWPKMTREQLVRIFPNGRTLHIPSDGKPLPGYEIALAEYKARQARGGSHVQLAAANVAAPSSIPAAPAGRAVGERPTGLVAAFIRKPEPAPVETTMAAVAGEDEPETLDTTVTGATNGTPVPRPAPLRLAGVFERQPEVVAPAGTTARRYMLVGKATPGKSIAQRVAVSFDGIAPAEPEQRADRVMAFASAETSGRDPLRLMRAEPAPAAKKPREIAPVAARETPESPVTTASLPPREIAPPVRVWQDPVPRLAFVAAEADWGRTLWTVNTSTRQKRFAELMMPDPEVDPTILMAPVRVVAGGFSDRPYGELRTDHFAGVVVQPVSTIEFLPERRFAWIVEH